MTYAYDFAGLNSIFREVLQARLAPDTMKWLESEGKAAAAGNISKLNIAFVTMPRRTGKQKVKLSGEEVRAIRASRPGLTADDWAIDRLARVWLLMQLDASDKNRYRAAIENLFLTAEMEELVALYSALPVLAYPASWTGRCAEGIRSNIGQVLEAVICNNPYPAEHLDEAAWNQLVLKAIFTEKPVLEISGLRARRNEALARSLSDYAHERWAAHREVNPLLWICVAPYIGDANFADIQRLLSSGDVLEREAGALACHESSFAAAKEKVSREPALKSGIQSGAVSWEGIARKLQAPAQ